MRLLRDSEAEVRVAAAGKVSAFSKLLAPMQIVPTILPCVTELAQDSSQYVRAALAVVGARVFVGWNHSSTIHVYQ